jgi:uncharacterized protein YjbI with pentapeptide repeats
MKRFTLGTFLVSTMVALAPAQADIYQWEYINPADPSLGRQQSTSLAPDGAGVDAVPGSILNSRNLTKAYLIGADLSTAKLVAANLFNADLGQANLTGANLNSAILAGANLTGSQVQGASFTRNPSIFSQTGLTLAQLYSTASYQASDLTGINLRSNLLSGANFVGVNLTSAQFPSATLTAANFSQANLTNAHLEGADLAGANFAQATNLTGAHFNGNLTNVNFTQANLTGAHIVNATLTGADFTDAWIGQADFHFQLGLGTGISVLQLYSTASYQTGDLSGIDLSENDMHSANFAGLDLTNAVFNNTNLMNADLSGADTRGSFGGYFFNSANAVLANTIFYDGSILDLNLGSGQSLVIRDYDGGPYLESPNDRVPITVSDAFQMDSGSTMRFVFDADAWDSTISFYEETSVSRGGTLELLFAPGVNVVAQIGRTFKLFDWTGLSPSGEFSVASPYVWNLSNLYTTGEVTLAAMPEPSSLPLAALAGSGLLWRRRAQIAPIF